MPVSVNYIKWRLYTNTYTTHLQYTVNAVCQTQRLYSRSTDCLFIYNVCIEVCNMLKNNKEHENISEVGNAAKAYFTINRNIYRSDHSVDHLQMNT